LFVGKADAADSSRSVFRYVQSRHRNATSKVHRAHERERRRAVQKEAVPSVAFSEKPLCAKQWAQIKANLKDMKKCVSIKTDQR
jgi:hypothetical protein